MTHDDQQPTAGRPATPVDVELRAILDDADYTRRLAIEALQNGRTELGVGLANLALRAARAAGRYARVNHLTAADIVNVPFLGATRDEQPRNTDNACSDEWQPAHAAGSRPDSCATCSAGLPPGPTGNGDADLQRAETSIFNAVDTAGMPAPESSRCKVMETRRDGNNVMINPCRRVIFLEHETGVWRHLDPAWDADHTPKPWEGNQP